MHLIFQGNLQIQLSCKEVGFFCLVCFLAHLLYKSVPQITSCTFIFRLKIIYGHIGRNKMSLYPVVLLLQKETSSKILQQAQSQIFKKEHALLMNHCKSTHIHTLYSSDRCVNNTDNTAPQMLNMPCKTQLLLLLYTIMNNVYRTLLLPAHFKEGAMSYPSLNIFSTQCL